MKISSKTAKGIWPFTLLRNQSKPLLKQILKSKMKISTNLKSFLSLVKYIYELIAHKEQNTSKMYCNRCHNRAEQTNVKGNISGTVQECRYLTKKRQDFMILIRITERRHWANIFKYKKQSLSVKNFRFCVFLTMLLPARVSLPSPSPPYSSSPSTYLVFYWRYW